MSRQALLIAVAVTLALAASGCGGSRHTSSSTGAKRTLTDLHSINQLRAAFNRASGEPRLIVLVSPT